MQGRTPGVYTPVYKDAGSGSCLDYSVADHQAVDQMSGSSLCAVDPAKLERTYNESVATGQSDAPSRGLDFLDP